MFQDLFSTETNTVLEGAARGDLLFEVGIWVRPWMCSKPARAPSNRMPELTPEGNYIICSSTCQEFSREWLGYLSPLVMGAVVALLLPGARRLLPHEST